MAMSAAEKKKQKDFYHNQRVMDEAKAKKGDKKAAAELGKIKSKLRSSDNASAPWAKSQKLAMASKPKGVPTKAESQKWASERGASSSKTMAKGPTKKPMMTMASTPKPNPKQTPAQRWAKERSTGKAAS